MTKLAAIKTSKESFGFRAVAIDRNHEYSDADIAVSADTRLAAIKLARQALRKKGYKIVPQWEI
jgi:hypothetical protein